MLWTPWLFACRVGKHLTCFFFPMVYCWEAWDSVFRGMVHCEIDWLTISTDVVKRMCMAAALWANSQQFELTTLWISSLFAYRLEVSPSIHKLLFNPLESESDVRWRLEMLAVIPALEHMYGFPQSRVFKCFFNSKFRFWVLTSGHAVVARSSVMSGTY